jgi:hypothetical protein
MRDIMKGRHNTGGRTANPGKIKGGQSEPASNKVVTASSPRTSSKKPFVPDSKETSQDEMNFIKQAPMPFKDKNSTGMSPSPSAPKGAVPGQEPKNIYAGKSGNSAPKNPAGQAVGYSKLPNQSGQIGGRMGFPPPARKAGAQNLSSVKGGSHFFGDKR